jgi:hypothetical protein
VPPIHIVPVVQWIELGSSKSKILVRFQAGIFYPGVTARSYMP